MTLLSMMSSPAFASGAIPFDFANDDNLRIAFGAQDLVDRQRRPTFFPSKGAVLYCFFLSPRIFCFLYSVLGKICFVCSQDGGRRVSALRPRGKRIGEDVGAAAVLSLGGVRPVADHEASTSWLWGDILEWFYEGNMASGRRRMWECNDNDEKMNKSAQKVHL